MGQFRITSSDIKVRELEHHLSQGNYSIFNNDKLLKDPHIVANYLKRLLRESYYPLIPQEQIEDFQRASINTEEGLDISCESIKQIVEKLPVLNRNILQFLAKFFKVLVGYEPQNKMTAYNVAVTVAPNIFRTEVEETDLGTHGVFY